MTAPRIAIIGAGVAGLTLARVLQINGISAEILERDASRSKRKQGGTLDLRPDSGQAALQIANLYKEFRALMRLEGQDMTIADKDYNILLSHVAGEGEEYNPEIDRAQLRGIFLDVLSDEMKWGSHVKSTQPHTDNGYLVTFADGTSKVYDLVIGADGCHSRIRPLLSDVTPKYTGLIFIETYIMDAGNRFPKDNKIVGKGTLCTSHNHQGIFAQQNGDNTLRVYSILTVPENWPKTCGIPWDNAAVARERILEKFSDWCPTLRNLIIHSDDEIRLWPIYALPTGFKWAHKRGITLIGDAAHVMSPFAGEGANLAMWDGANLGLTIAEAIRNGVDLDDAVAQFEEKMFTRAAFSAEIAASNLENFMVDAQNMANTINKLIAGAADQRT